MALNLTKGKTTRKAGAPKAAIFTPAQANISAAEAQRLITAAMHPKTHMASDTQTAAPATTQATTPAKATTSAPATKPTEPGKTATPAKPATPLQTFPAMEAGQHQGLLMRNILQAKALASCPVVNEHLALTHEQYGTILLRMVTYNSGFLIGLIDQDNATYCECEFFDTAFAANAAWPEWIAALSL